MMSKWWLSSFPLWSHSVSERLSHTHTYTPIFCPQQACGSARIMCWMFWIEPSINTTKHFPSLWWSWCAHTHTCARPCPCPNNPSIVRGSNGVDRLQLRHPFRLPPSFSQKALPLVDRRAFLPSFIMTHRPGGVAGKSGWPDVPWSDMQTEGCRCYCGPRVWFYAQELQEEWHRSCFDSSAGRLTRVSEVCGSPYELQNYSHAGGGIFNLPFPSRPLNVIRQWKSHRSQCSVQDAGLEPHTESYTRRARVRVVYGASVPYCLPRLVCDTLARNACLAGKTKLREDSVRTIIIIFLLVCLFLGKGYSK